MNDLSVKEGCASGDCGACTVALGELSPDGLQWRAVNSCIQPAHSAHGKIVMTAGQLSSPAQPLHVVQSKLIEHHGSQCGFCTPGIVMSLFALNERHRESGRPVSRHDAIEALSGNLCRCTGYRPIVDAACQMAKTDEASHDEYAKRNGPLWVALQDMENRDVSLQSQLCAQRIEGPFYLRPRTLAQLLQARSHHPDALLVAGATDLGIGVNEGKQTSNRWIDLNHVLELRAIEQVDGDLVIGAAVPLQEAFDAMIPLWPSVAQLRDRFAGWPVRQSGTLGGNIANGSPIGDSMPMLIALGARITLSSWSNGLIQSRQMPLEDFYVAYRQTQLRADEVLNHIRIPLPRSGQTLWVDKLSKRIEDDISAVCMALSLTLDGTRILNARLGLGGVAATPWRHQAAEQVLKGKNWNEKTVEETAAVLMQTAQPISDMRASASYRKAMLGEMLFRFWHRHSSPDAPNGLSVQSSWIDGAVS